MQSTIHTTGSPASGVVIGAEDDAAYRTISVLALVSLALGIAAPLAFFAPLLMVIPIAGAVLALLAIARIASSDGALIGRKAAMIGLVCSIASMSAAYTRTTLTQELLSRQARTTALQWFELLQNGDADQAFQLMVASRQSPPKINPDDPQGEAPAEKPLDVFRANPVVHFLLEHAQQAPVNYVQDVAYELAPAGSAKIRQLFTVGVPTADGGASSTAVDVVMQRARSSSVGPLEWLVSSATSDDLPPDPHEHDHSGHVH